MAVRRLTVPPDASPRLDAFLAKSLPGWTKPQIQKLLADGRVKVNGKKAKPLRRVVGGEEVELDLPEARRADVPRAAMKGPSLRVLFDGAGFYVIDKPAGLVVEQEDDRPSVVALAASQLRGFEVGGRAEPGIVHRLDKDTTGCLLLAKTDEAMLALQRGFDEKRIKKTYLALVLGEPPDTGVLDTPYGRHPEDPRRYTTRFPSPRRARLSWKKLAQRDDHALLEIDLDTGRTHQIRAQLADVGHPLLGDWLYGTRAAKELGIGRIALHAWKLTLIGFGPAPLEIEAPLPPDFEGSGAAAARGMPHRS
ncbi:MAG: RluA family pseudouridine synthase [Myxococcota bacterium]